ncbi:MAG: helix-turn-helix transcriptional regulator [Proteobacteria bacterium]|nr:helix-turn-helix transcriptional regulator [Pseudomonadota bacterium]
MASTSQGTISPGIGTPSSRGTAAAEFGAEQLSELLGLVYESALQPENWTLALAAICRAFDAKYASLIVRPGANDQPGGLIVSAAAQRQVLDTSKPPLHLSPFNGLTPDRVVTVDDILSEADWRGSAYYRDWCASHDVFHVMAVDIQTREGSVHGLRITRAECAPRFSAADRARCEMLVPHLRRLLNLHLLLNQDREINRVYGQAMAHLMVGAIMLDGQGRVLECNAMARAIAEMNDGLAIQGGRLEAAFAAENRRLQRLVREALEDVGKSSLLRPAAAISVSRPSGKVSWGIVVQTVNPHRGTEGTHRPCVALFLRDTDSKASPPVRLAQELFHLTGAETMLAIQLANGLSMEEAAVALNIKRNTARAHLRSIFAKVGVRRQTELVRIFLNSVLLLGTAD